MTERFTVSGSRNGSPVTVTWADGALSGDPPTLDLLVVEAELARTGRGDRQSWSHFAEAAGPLPDEPLRDAAATWRLIVSVLDTINSVEGDAPQGSLEELQRQRAQRGRR
jgi:hypothetical protein